jgi:hypothetical protein
MENPNYIYCLSNEAMPGILKLCLASQIPASSQPSIDLPYPFKLELIKQVVEPENKMVALHALLDRYSNPVNARLGYYRISHEDMQLFFNIIEGTDCLIDSIIPEQQQQTINEPGPEPLGQNTEARSPISRRCRDMRACFLDGQAIRHVIGPSQFIGNYSSSTNTIISQDTDEHYKAPSTFAQAHYNRVRPGRKSVNGWAECECLVHGQWVSIFNL